MQFRRKCSEEYLVYIREKYLCNQSFVESLRFMFSCSVNYFSFASTQFSISSFEGCQNHIAFLNLQVQEEPFICNLQVSGPCTLIFESRQQIHLLAAWGRLEFNSYFTATNPWITGPLGNRLRSSLQSHPKWLWGSADSDVHTTWDEGPDDTLNL